MKTPKYPVVLLDFDGTLVDTGPGLVMSMGHAGKEKGVSLPLHETWRFIGPPLVEFTASLGIEEAFGDELIKTFRAHYNTVGWQNSVPYPGIPELLQALADAGTKIYVCTSKPEAIATMMMAHFSLPNHGVCGANERIGLHDKDAIIRLAAERYGFALDNSAVMVGDAPRDIFAGQDCGTATIAVGYGYGLADDLAASGADFYAATVAELSELLL